MGNEYRFQKLNLIESNSVYEFLLIILVKIWGYFLCYLSNIKNISISGLRVSPNIFRKESICVVENGYKVYRRQWSKTKVEDSFKGMKTAIEIFKNLVNTAPDREIIGFRPILNENIIQEGNRSRNVRELGPFQWLTTKEVYSRIVKVAFYMTSLGIKQGDNIVIFAETSVDYFVIALAANMIRATYATIYPNLPNDYIASCIDLIEPKLIFLDKKCYICIYSMISNFQSIKNIIFATDCEKENFGILSYYFQCMKLSNIISCITPPQYFDKSIENPHPDDIATIMFTSGSTGSAKGVMITHMNIVSIICGVVDQEYVMKDQTYAAYLPLSHILELCCEISSISYGGKIGYCHPGTLFDESPNLSPHSISDLRALNPTSLASVPLILERIKRKFFEILNKQSRYKKIIFQELYNIKTGFLEYGYVTPYLDKLFFKKFTSMFGNKFKYSLIGGAYLPLETEEFFNVVYGIFKQVYGATEVVGAGTTSNYDYTRPGNVGPPFCSSEIRLIPWEEGGFEMKNEENPTGEILISGTCLTKGYYKNPEATKESFVYDSQSDKIWYHSQDIGTVLDDGTFRIIGRKSDNVKLSSGEFVQLNRVEDSLKKCEMVEYICVTTNENKEHLIAIISLNSENVLKFATSHNIYHSSNNVDELISNDSFKRLIELEFKYLIANYQSIGRNEIPKRYLMTTDLWTPEEGLLTPTRKIKRYKIVEKYKEIINMLK